MFPVRVTGAVKHLEATDQGGALGTSLGSFGVDFSRKSGADAVLVLTGPITGTPKGATVAKADETTYTVMTLQKGDPPEIKTEGDALNRPQAEGAKPPRSLEQVLRCRMIRFNISIDRAPMSGTVLVQ